MTFPDVHLAGEAVVAFVDGELAPVAHARALAHLAVCAECGRAVGAQRDTSRLLAGASDPVLPAGLLSRLRDIPMTAELGGRDVVLAVDGDDLVWGTASSLRTRPTPTNDDGGGSRPDPRPGGPHHRPASYSSTRSSTRRSLHPRQARRALAGAVAGLAFGVCVATASTSVYSHTNTPDRNLIRDVNGGVIGPPVTGQFTQVHNLRAPDSRPNQDDPNGSSPATPNGPAGPGDLPGQDGTAGWDGRGGSTNPGQPVHAARSDPQATPPSSPASSDSVIVPVGSRSGHSSAAPTVASVSGVGMR